MTRVILAAAAALLLLSTPALAQTLPPVDVYQDPNGIDLVSNNVSTSKAPVLSIPAAPDLTFSDLDDFIPLIEVKTGSGTPGMEPVRYVVNAGSIASDRFAQCDTTTCYAENGTGSQLQLQGDEGSPGMGLGGYQYTQGGTGKFIQFDTQTEIFGGTAPPPSKKFLAHEVLNPGGVDLSFEYQSAFVSNATRHRPVKVTSVSGYMLKFTYWSDQNDLNWGFLKKAEIVSVTNPTVPLASLTYQGGAADIAGRFYECACTPSIYGTDNRQKASRMQLPGESVYSFQTTRAQNSSTRTVTSDGVVYQYVSTPDPGWFNTPDAIKDLTITGPGGFSLVIDVTNLPALTGTYDPPRRRIDSITDSLGRVTRYEHSSGQRVRKVIYPEGNSVEVDYDQNGNVTARRTIAKPGSGRATLLEGAGYAASCSGFTCYLPDWTRDAKLNQTDYTWDNAHGGLLTRLDPADAQGRRRKVKNTYSTTAPISGETCGTMTSIGLPDGPRCAPRLIREEICEANSAGVELTCGTAQALVRTLTYFRATTLPLSETISSGGQSLTTTYTYDDAGRLLSSDPPRSDVDDATHYRYDAAGRRTWEIGPPDAGGYRLATRTTYRNADDKPLKVERGRIASLADTNLEVFDQTEAAYDQRRLPTTSRLVAAGTTYSLTQFGHDALNRPECTAVRMNPAAYGSLPASACNLGAQGSHGPDRITRNVYDAAGQLLQVREGVGSDVESAEATYSYTLNGRKAQIVDANGNRAELRYDGYDRWSRWVFPSATRPSAFNDATPASALATAGALNENDREEYSYDANGNRTSLRKRDGSTLTYGYDALNRMTVKVVPERAGLAATHTRDVHYGYDFHGHPTFARFDSASGEGIANVWDGLGRLHSTTLAMDGASRTLGYQHDANGNRTRLTYPDAAHFGYVYDAQGRLTQLTDPAGNVLHAFAYTNAGLLGGIAAYGGAQDIAIGRDAAQRVTSYAIANGSSPQDVHSTFAYNPAGQVASEARDNDAYAYTAQANQDVAEVPDGLNRLVQRGSATLTYDANGNLTSDGTNAYTYDVENRLVARSGAGTAGLRYDPLGRLYETTGGAEGTIRYLHDGDDLVAEYYASGSMRARNIHGADPSSDDALLDYGGSSTSLGSARWLYPDRLGSHVLRADASGSSASVNRYDEYGVPQAGNVGRFQYTGQAWLPEVGLYYYKARMYHPGIGRFMQTDPIGYDDGLNLYAYVGNDPVNKSDSTGTSEGDAFFTGLRWAQVEERGGPTAEEQAETEAKQSAAVLGTAAAVYLLRQAALPVLAWAGKALKVTSHTVAYRQASRYITNHIRTELNRGIKDGLIKAARHEARGGARIGGRDHLAKAENALGWVRNQIKRIEGDGNMTSDEKAKLVKQLESYQERLEDARTGR